MKRPPRGPMKILLVHNHYQCPGGEDVVFAQERRLLESYGHQLITYERSNEEINAYSTLRKLTVPLSAVWAADSRKEILEILRREKPDIVHVHNTFLQISPSIFSACVESGVPVIQTLHNFRLLCPAATFFRDGSVCEDCLQSLWHGVRHRCYRKSLSQTGLAAMMLSFHRRWRTWDAIAGFIVLTRFGQKKFEDAGLSPEKIYVKPNFVLPDPGEKNEGGNFAVYVGRLSDEKGVGTLLEACKDLPPHIPVKIIGDGPLRSALEQQASEKGLTNVRFLGQLSHEDAQRAIKAARILILPSECYENFPMTVIEAFASGTPVICSRLGALQEIVTDEVTGLHFTAGDGRNLAQKIIRMWDHPRKARAMGKEARAEFERRYTAEKNYLRLMDIYNQALSSFA